MGRHRKQTEKGALKNAPFFCPIEKLISRTPPSPFSAAQLIYNGYRAAICFLRSVRLSAIIAMHSEFVGFPFTLLTV